MKKMFSVLLITTIITTLGSPVYASSQNPKKKLLLSIKKRITT